MLTAFLAILIKAGVASVEVFRVQIILSYSHSVAKALEVNYLALTQELDDVVNVGVVGKTENIVIGRASLLLSRQVLVKVGEDISLDADVLHVKGYSCGRYGIGAVGMVHEVGGKGCAVYLVHREIFGKLVNNSRDDF